MPTFRKLNAAETAALDPPRSGVRAQIAREYDAYMTDFAAGDYGRVDLSAGDRRAQVRARLQAAARRRGLALRFRPGPSTAMIFYVEAAPAAAPVPTRATPADQSSREPARGNGAPPRPPRQRQTAAEQYRTMLPRWMCERQPSNQHRESKRRQGR